MLKYGNCRRTTPLKGLRIGCTHAMGTRGRMFDSISVVSVLGKHPLGFKASVMVYKPFVDKGESVVHRTSSMHVLD